MMQVTDMANERQHQFKIMLSDEEKSWLEALASNRGLTSSDVLRLYIREAHEQLRPVVVGRESSDLRPDFRWIDEHADVLTVVAREKDPIPTEDIRKAMHEGVDGTYYDGRWRRLPTSLNQLTRNGYLRRMKSGYVITAKGRATLK